MAEGAGLEVARACRETKAGLRSAVSDCAWGLFILGCIFVGYLAAAAR